MILVLSSHPDDAELGAGGTLAHIQEEKVGFCFTAHSAFHHLLPEMKNAWEILKIGYLPDHDQNFKHREFNRQHVLDMLIRLREEFKPKLVFTHSSFDCHQDHKVIYEESVRAFKHCTILGYNLEWNNVGNADFRHYKSLPFSAVEKKLQALACYESQSHRTYFDKEYQYAQMIFNGQKIDSLYAEKFEIIRWVER